MMGHCIEKENCLEVLTLQWEDIHFTIGLPSI